MDYLSSLEYLYALQHFGIKLGLENTRRLLERLGNPQHRLRIVHIAGTNGKGSTAAALEQLLRGAGLCTGLYTSPHLHSFTERIRIDNQPIAEAEVIALTENIRRCAADLNPTFFEFTTAMALAIFAQKEVDWVILETGLGGRLDSTNVVDPAVCIITSIALDHAEHLGSDLIQIAGEKAGIIKTDVPLICARQQAEVQDHLQQIAAEKNAPVYLAGRDFSWSLPPDGFDYQGVKHSLGPIESGLVGTYQRENISLALAATELVLEDHFSPEVSCRSLNDLRWPGRLEWCGNILFDGAHNPHAAKALADYLKEEGLQDLLWVVGAKADKDVAGIMTPLLPMVSRVFATPVTGEAASTPGLLLAEAAKAEVLAEAFTSPAEALQTALAVCRPEQKILVAGSLLLVGALRHTDQNISGVPV